jgi:ABC-2 type transport system ATP-binding protein
VLERVGLTSRRDRMLTSLSGGERQRLLLAAAIIGARDLLVLDEPTAAMDVAAKAAFWTEARASVTDGATLIFATHDVAEADDHPAPAADGSPSAWPHTASWRSSSSASGRTCYRRTSRSRSRLALTQATFFIFRHPSRSG